MWPRPKVHCTSWPGSGWIDRLPADRDIARLLRYTRDSLTAAPRAAEGLACCIPCGWTAGCACRGALQRIESSQSSGAALFDNSPVRGLRAAADDPATQSVSAARHQSWRGTTVHASNGTVSREEADEKGTPGQGQAQRRTPPSAAPLLPRLLPALYYFDTGRQRCALLPKAPHSELQFRHACSADQRCL